MTIFGWDASHYDGELSRATLARARNEGIEFFTHKLGEGLSNTDATAEQALAAARDAGIRVVGGYYFIHSGDMVAQAVRCVELTDQLAPWWREFDGWFWQTDAETDTGGHLPSPAEVKLFSDTLATRSRRRVIVYASHGMYGDRLEGLGHPLWNANYPSSRRDDFKSLYPGDHYSGWNDYSGQTPALCQYTSSATIAGKTTCDANAYRGTIDQLLALINPGGVTVTAPTPQQNARELMSGLQEDKENKGYTGKVNVTAGTDLGGGADAAREARDTVKRVENKVDQVLALLQGGVAPTGGTTVSLDPATVEEIAVAVADETHDRMAG